MIYDPNNSWGFSTNWMSMPSNINYGAMNSVGAQMQSQAASNLSVPSVGQPGQQSVGTGFGFNLPTAQLALGGLQTLGAIWNGWEANKLANKQFAYKKDVTETNLRNQIQAYNTTLEDRGRSRAHTEGQSQAQAQSYIENNRLRR